MSDTGVVNAPSARSGADAAMCRILCIPDERPAVAESAVQRLFSASIVLSALRCVFTYVILPVVTPLIGAATSVGPAIGIPTALVALVFDVRGVRRFWLARHRSRWAFTFLYLAVMGLVTVLLVTDVAKLAR